MAQDINMKCNVTLLIIVLDILNSGMGFLNIIQYATKGKNATLECRFPVPNVYLVLWNNTRGIQAVCEDSGFCGNVTDRRYHPSIQTDHSIFYITGADHNMDEGTWSCEINSQFASRTEVTVYSLPESFYIDKPSSLLNEIKVNGVDQLELEVVAVCIYPLENNIYLQYQIKGDNTLNYYSKKNIEIQNLTNTNCLDHEFVVTANLILMEFDFDGLTIYFQFQYKTTFGYILNTKSIITAVFEENPCQLNPCLNGGTCEVSSKQFFCSCLPRFKGQHCENKVNPCDFNLCRNGATCQSNLNTFQWTCKCASNYTGALCDEKDLFNGSSKRNKLDPVLLIPLSLIILWHQALDPRIFNKCLIIISFLCMLFWRANGSVDFNNDLLIGLHPTKGAKGIISCRIYAITKNVLVEWNHNGVIITCTLPESTCTYNQFYRASISRTFSNLTVWNANFTRDSGLWTCTVNNLTSNGILYVVTDPTIFSMHDGNEKNFTKSNWTLTADAYCVYPDLANTFLLYQVKGDAHYQDFKKRNTSILYYDGKKHGCENNEYVLRMTGIIQMSDFSGDLLVRFKFQYISLSGNHFDTRTSDYTMFTDNPCRFVSCENGGQCTLDEEQVYRCVCVNPFSGKHCEESPKKPVTCKDQNFKTYTTEKVCCWILTAWAVITFPFIGLFVHYFRKAKNLTRPTSSDIDLHLVS